MKIYLSPEAEIIELEDRRDVIADSPAPAYDPYCDDVFYD